MKRLSTAIAASLLATPALAHHPLNGAPMETFVQGVVSGVGHPILGFDHLFFIIAVGIAAIFTGRARLAPMGYVGGMLAGVLLIVGGIALPAVELVIATSLVIVGAILMSGRSLGLPRTMALFAGLGLFHGWAFGGAIAGQELAVGGGVLIGYLLGLAATQWAVAALAGYVAVHLWNAETAQNISARLAGGVVAGVGALLVLEQAEAATFAVLGIG